MLTATITLIGWIGKVTQKVIERAQGDPLELRVVRLGVWRDQVGEDGKRPTDWYTLEVWGDKVGALFDDAKGRLVAIQGVPRVDTFDGTFQTEEGQEFTAPVTALRVTVRDFRFLDKPAAQAEDEPVPVKATTKKATPAAAKRSKTVVGAKTAATTPKKTTASKQPSRMAAGAEDESAPF